MKYENHELSLLFPDLSGKNMQELIEDIRMNGLIDPIVLFEGKILDGRHRYSACLAAGRECRFVELVKEVNPLRFVVSKNSIRRHLTNTERAFIAAKIANMGEGGDKRSERYHSADLPSDKVSQAEAAKEMKVSERAVRKAKRVLEKGSPELVQSVRNGETSLDAADRKLSGKTGKEPFPGFKADGFKMLKGGFLLSPDVSQMETEVRRRIDIGALPADKPYRLWQLYRSKKFRTRILNLLGKEFSSEDMPYVIEMVAADFGRQAEVTRQKTKHS